MPGPVPGVLPAPAFQQFFRAPDDPHPLEAGCLHQVFQDCIFQAHPPSLSSVSYILPPWPSNFNTIVLVIANISCVPRFLGYNKCGGRVCFKTDILRNVTTMNEKRTHVEAAPAPRSKSFRAPRSKSFRAPRSKSFRAPRSKSFRVPRSKSFRAPRSKSFRAPPSFPTAIEMPWRQSGIARASRARGPESRALSAHEMASLPHTISRISTAIHRKANNMADTACGLVV